MDRPARESSDPKLAEGVGEVVPGLYRESQGRPAGKDSLEVPDGPAGGGGGLRLRGEDFLLVAARGAGSGLHVLLLHKPGAAGESAFCTVGIWIPVQWTNTSDRSCTGPR